MKMPFVIYHPHDQTNKIGLLLEFGFILLIRKTILMHKLNITNNKNKIKRFVCI